MTEKKEEIEPLKIKTEDAHILYALGIEQVLIGLRILKIIGESSPGFPQAEYDIFSALFEEFGMRQQRLNQLFESAKKLQGRPAFDEHMGYL